MKNPIVNIKIYVFQTFGKSFLYIISKHQILKRIYYRTLSMSVNIVCSDLALMRHCKYK